MSHVRRLEHSIGEVLPIGCMQLEVFRPSSESNSRYGYPDQLCSTSAAEELPVVSGFN